ncbi:MAG: hypothetical protein R3176_00225 [Woeseiaceae bacterium]|nr:hypothetical protein [Woeseiaceae bacterium]
MPRPPTAPARLRLPARIRVRRTPEEELDVLLAFADRIGGLPGIRTLDDSDDRLTGSVVLVLDPLSATDSTAPLLCRISREGLAVYGLSDWDRHQVLLSGWGRLSQDHVLLHLPRDQRELDVCWRIVEHAFIASTLKPHGSRAARAASPWDLPRFSRTSLQ